MQLTTTTSIKDRCKLDADDLDREIAYFASQTTRPRLFKLKGYYSLDNHKDVLPHTMINIQTVDGGTFCVAMIKIAVAAQITGPTIPQGGGSWYGTLSLWNVGYLLRRPLQGFQRQVGDAVTKQRQSFVVDWAASQELPCE